MPLPLSAVLFLSVAVLPSGGCAPASLRGSSRADRLDAPDGIVALARSGDVVYALGRDGKLRSWDLETRALRTLDRGGVLAISRDGAVALGGSQTVIEAWDPTSGRVIASHRFEYGVGGVVGVSPSAAYVVAKLAPINWPPNAAPTPPPDRELVSWDFASGKIEVIGARPGCDSLSLSVDGGRTLCDLAWRVRRSGVVRGPPPLAPEWAPPEPEPEPPPCHKCSAHFPETGHLLLSAWLSDDGRTVYLTYVRTVGGREWRLDRWTPDTAGKTEGRIEHLAVSHEAIGDRVIAVSPDGGTVVADPGVRPPVLRHAPGYEGVPLLGPPATAAVFSADGRLVVTGHGDGRLRVWDAVGARLVGSSGE